MNQQNKVTGVILAGGLARRMQQQDKGLILLHDKPLVSYAIAAMAPVVDALVINANRNQAEYQQFGYPVVSDQNLTFAGPLAGILAVMTVVPTDLLLVMPCDSPLIRPEHLQKMLKTQAEQDADCAVASDGERLHPVFLVLKSYLKTSLEQYLEAGERKIDRWLMQHDWVQVDFSDQPEVFQNINTPEQLKQVAEVMHEK
ncbi:molybdenum cofactor guanylyltransferase MobA [methane-oxidizing endosymbiont of Gigantopelta aegis]|uniref:molybdenum cofactor guanylyltransferase MobA n=1 Tax=methane-oxidizing endosymbiont of Gigantopelta aegis TaxID=2794938 RepID=UPI0018DD9B25|nr:molybdenum cofactor guanylyltransferase MobA [methane-oxidizing endosymbiont of Gigantopelta aegis]